MSGDIVDELRLEDGLLIKLQAKWRGAVLRKQLKRCQMEYETIFFDIEDSSSRSCTVEWPSTCVGRPRYVDNSQRSLHKQMKVQQHVEAEQNSNRTAAPNLLSAVAALSNDDSRLAIEHVDRTETPHADQQLLQRSAVDGELQTESSLDVESQSVHPVEEVSRDIMASDKLKAAELTKVPLVGSSLEEKRHNLALELLWIQQAIHSRKQVLSSSDFFDVA